MRKILGLLGLICLLLFGGGLSRAAGESAMCIAWVNPNMVSDISETESIMTKGLTETLAKYGFRFMDAAESQMALQQYMIEHDIVPNDNESSVGFLPKKAILKELAAENHVDYIVFSNVRITDSKEKAAFFAPDGVKTEVTALFTTMVYSAKEDRHLFFKQQSVKENASGEGKTDRAFQKCCKTYFKKILTPETFILK